MNEFLRWQSDEFPQPVFRVFPEFRCCEDGQICFVKICIQHQGTRKFLRGVDSWVDSMGSARLFANSMEALRHCVNNPLGQVNIIIDRGFARPPIIIAVEGAQVPIQLAPGPLRAAA